MHVPINVKSPNNISKWQMGFNSAFKGLMAKFYIYINKRFLFLAFKTEEQANTPTAVLKKTRILVSDVYEYFMWETDDTVYKRVDGVTKCQQGKIELCTGI
jgi:hypothetical protein